jgi:hypothetical protein
MTHTAVVPATHQSGPLKGPLEQVPPRLRVHTSLDGFRLARGFTAPSSRLRVARGFASASLETPSHARPFPHAGTNIYCSGTAGWRRPVPGNHAPALLRQLPRGNPSPPLWGTMRHGQCQLRGTAPPTPVRLTRRALEGGPATPLNRFLVNLQGQIMTLGRRDAIPATVDPVRPPPCSQHHARYYYNHSGAVRHTGTDAATPATVSRTDRR